MPITVECSSCGKQYNAPEAMAGKSVKCKNCGQIFQIPGGGEQGIVDELSALSMLERSFHEGEPAPAGVHAEPTPPPSVGWNTTGSTGAGEEDIPFAPRGSG